jgi:hypothetical protein
MLETIKKTLNSTRFWSLVLGSAIFYLKTKGFVGEPEMIMIETILGGFIAINTSSKYESKK